MSKEQSPARYPPIHVTLHWLIALLVIMMLGIGKLAMPGIPADHPQKTMILQMHVWVGAAIAFLLIVRLILRFLLKRPAPADAGSPILNSLAQGVHFLLYLILIGMAVSGLGIFEMADLSAVFSGSSPYPVDFFQYLPRMGHGLVSWILLLLIGLHVAAALYHQFIRRDGLLGRMWYGKG